MTQQNLPFWLALLLLPEASPRRVARWLSVFGDAEKLCQATKSELLAAGLTDSQIAALKQPDELAIERYIRWQEQADHHIVALDDEYYPVLLREIADPPPVLFVRGNVAALRQPQIAMVGSRHATPGGCQLAKQFASVLAQAGYVITSGLALGIDGAGHEGALAVKKATVAVLGTGVDQVYPRSHLRLSEQILQEGGAIVSEFPLGARPCAHHFPRRNRIIAGMSLGVLVVEAALRSGSLITANFALEQGRDVFAIPGSIHHPLSKGCHYLIRQGATLVECAQDILQEIGVLQQVCLLPAVEQPALSGHNSLIYDQIRHEITPIDMIELPDGLTAGTLSSILLILELDGYIQSVSGGYIRTIPTCKAG